MDGATIHIQYNMIPIIDKLMNHRFTLTFYEAKIPGSFTECHMTKPL